MKWLQFGVVVSAMSLTGSLINLTTWEEHRANLLVFLGIYGAALIQVAVTTANLNLPDHLTVDEARGLSNSLMKQQRYWIGLFLAIFAVVALLIFVPTVARKFSTLSIDGALTLDCQIIASALLGGALAFVLFHTVIFLDGLLSIQRLRSHLLVQGAIRRARSEAGQVSAAAAAQPARLPEGYGEVMRPH
ncbi:hypothetical protein [Azospirillum sp. A39]|uniref:hypothetical protein n=1 Tax=Azospirillum sp. A39 TaxID=3462279 RepID=UPI0040464F45